MNSSILDEVFMSPVAAHASALKSTTAQMVFKLAVASSVLVAVTAGLFTSSTACGTTPSDAVQYVVALLNQAGYQARVTGANLVVTW